MCLLNPMLLFEVLSPATRDYDRGAKRDHYHQIPTLRHLLLIDQPTFLSVSYTKKNAWLATSRQTSISAVGGPDYLGVYVRALHTSAMQAIVPSRNLTDTVVMRLEPTR